eukprot:m.32696 g.32696  ORF g.32696 m.32696 type:complete len:605 (-) comp16681_c0_seq1:114-1928(-)
MSSVTVSGSKVIIVGGGLAGMSAAHTVLQAGGRCLLLDKSPFCGGNSTKATSGINAAGTRSQRLLKIPDSAEQFEIDTVKSAAEGLRPELVRALVYTSGPAVDWLTDAFGLKLDSVSRLGAHTHPRTHRGGAGGQFPGMMITYGLMDAFEQINEKDPSMAQILNKAKVTELIRDANGNVCGVTYVKGGQSFKEYGPVIISTGGFAADFSDNSLLASVASKWRSLDAWNDIPNHLLPNLIDLPTTNGPHCTGDGLKMSMDVGAGTRDLHCVQVHPTGITDPTDPDNKVKRLAAEALRGEGGFVIDRDGRRFANELGKRDYVSGRMWARDRAPYRLLLNSKSASNIAWHCKHYEDNGLMKRMTGHELAKDMGIDYKVLHDTCEKYSADAEHNAKTGEPDEFGKLYFKGTPVSADDQFYVAQVGPIVHYTMGGVSSNEHGEVVDASEKVIKGLYAAGEVIGGIHGVNRLGGSSLLDCLVYGRLSGASATKYLLENLSIGNQIGEAGSNVKSNTVAAAAKVVIEEKTTPYTMAQVQQHKSADDCWVVVDGSVYDCTEFLNEHPGGKRVIVNNAGKDATEQFHMMHAPSILPKHGPELKVGVVVPAAKL